MRGGFAPDWETLLLIRIRILRPAILDCQTHSFVHVGQYVRLSRGFRGFNCGREVKRFVEKNCDNRLKETISTLQPWSGVTYFSIAFKGVVLAPPSLASAAAAF